MDKLDHIMSEITKLLEAPALRNPRVDRSLPVISPSYVKRMSEILNVDLSQEPYQVTNMKTFLKTFMIQLRLDGRLAPEEVESCYQMIEEERAKRKLTPADLELVDVSCDKSAQIYCSECGRHANQFCVNCGDAFCSECGARMHTKGRRASHHINELLACQLCKNLPARYLCTYSFQVYCTSCMSRQTRPGLPADILRLTPLKIDYSISNNSKNVPVLTGELMSIAPKLSATRDMEDSSVVSPNWHPFIDASGGLYYYNFKTQESMRRIDQTPEAEKDPDAEHRAEQAIKKVLFATGPKYINL